MASIADDPFEAAILRTLECLLCTAIAPHKDFYDNGRHSQVSK